MKKKLIVLIVIMAIIAVFATACSGLSDFVSSNLEDLSAESGTVTEAEIAEASVEVEETLSDVSVENYSTSVVQITEEQTIASATEETVTIDLGTLTAENAPEGTIFSENVLTIKEAGSYLLTGTLNGAVFVDKEIEGTVQVILSNATIKTLETQTCAAIVFGKTDALRILTVLDNTINEVSDSVGDTEADGDGAAIQAKKCSLTINGKGTLKISAVGEDANGIKVKNELSVIDTTIEVTAVKNGIKAGTSIVLKGATISVTAGNDAMKTDVEPETEEEALAYAADSKMGYIYIENTSLTLVAGDDGISANNCLYIANGEDDVINITTNGGAPEKITTTSSDSADGKAIKVAGIVLEDADGNETLYPATYEANYGLVITGGVFNLNSNDDALHSKGNILISGGTFNIASGDDGIHAEYLTKITGGNILIEKSYEGVEGASVEITDGVVSVNAIDDGVNAANADLKNYEYYLLITGGEITINASGDGLDSNGKLLISGGKVTVFGPSNGGNSALDSVGNTVISGGVVVTTCREAMDPIGSTQYRVVANVNIATGTDITLTDKDGNVLVSFTMPKTCSNVLISTPEMKAEEYTLTYGSSTVTLTATTGTTGGMGMGGMNGQMMPGGFPGDGQTNGENGSFVPNGEPPQGAPQIGNETGDMPAFPSGGSSRGVPPTMNGDEQQGVPPMMGEGQMQGQMQGQMPTMDGEEQLGVPPTMDESQQGFPPMMGEGQMQGVPPTMDEFPQGEPPTMDGEAPQGVAPGMGGQPPQGRPPRNFSAGTTNEGNFEQRVPEGGDLMVPSTEQNQ